MAFPAVASSSVSTRPWPYEVFLSFRGADTRNNFIAHLFKALDQKGIHTYMDDDKLEGGEEISPTLLKAIKESKIVIIVLSKNYASSTWCLDELKEILECKKNSQQTVLPVFYKVLPSDVRYQKNKFGDALAKHSGRFKKEIVQRWKEDLEKVSQLSGYHLTKDRNESEFIDKIVQVVTKRVSPTCLNVSANSPVGIESSVEDINALLSIGMIDKRMVGIFGVGGIGKTTIANVIYNSIAHQFENKCFLENVRENSKREDGLVRLQEKLIFQILRDSNLKVHTVNLGKDVIKKRLCMKKVLLVLDDVDDMIQLEALSGELDWFGWESRIIITTRDQHLLAKHGVDLRHKMNGMRHNEALKLFSRHAFHSDKPNDDFVKLTKQALCYARGNPLALRVVGSNLYGKGIKHWNSELKKYKRIPPKNIYEILKISFDGLEDNEKNIFLDIACFFKGENVKYVTHILNSCDFSPDSGIEVLIDKSLITINESNSLVMHDLLQDMGRKIVHQESPNEPGKRSRLWYYEDVRAVLGENMGTNKIEGILVELPKRGVIEWNSNTFEKMKRLRYFISRNADYFEKPTYLPRELRVLDWTNCPLESLPSNFRGPKLTILKMGNCLIKGVKEGFQNLPSLRIMELFKLENLTEIPNFSGIPNLQELHVFLCKSLVKVDDSVGFLDKLTVLSFFQCPNLISLPKRMKFRSPEMLSLQYCSRLETFPEIECKMEPDFSRQPDFSRLFKVDVDSCENLTHFPSSILQLQQLHYLNVRRCPKLFMLPTNVRDERQSRLSIVSTEESRDLFLSPPLANSSISDVGCSSVAFPALTGLKLDKISFHFRDFPSSTFGDLTISGSEIVSLPAWIKIFVRLRSLQLFECKQLQEILELPANIQEICAGGCVSLESFPQISRENQFNTSQLPALEWINLSDCYKMAEKIGNQVEDFVLDKVHYNNSFVGGIVFPGNTIPDWFRHRKDCSYSSQSCIMDIKGLPHLDEIQGIVFSAVLEPISKAPEQYGADISQLSMHTSRLSMRTSIPNLCRLRYFTYMESKNVWYEFFAQESFEIKGDSLQARFSIPSKSFIRSVGVHIIHKHSENAKDHPDVTHVDFHFSINESNGRKASFLGSSSAQDKFDKEIENLVGLIKEDGVDEESENSVNSRIRKALKEMKRVTDLVSSSAQDKSDKKIENLVGLIKEDGVDEESENSVSIITDGLKEIERVVDLIIKYQMSPNTMLERRLESSRNPQTHNKRDYNLLKEVLNLLRE